MRIILLLIILTTFYNKSVGKNISYTVPEGYKTDTNAKDYKKKADISLPKVDFVNEYIIKNCKPADWFFGFVATRLNNLKGNIKSLIQEEYCLNENNLILELSKSSSNFAYFFNENHEIIRENNFEYKSYIDFKLLKTKMFDSLLKIEKVELYEYYNDDLELVSQITKTQDDGSLKITNFKIEKIDTNTQIYYGDNSKTIYFKGQIKEYSCNNSTIKYEYFDEYYVKTIYLYGVVLSREKFNLNGFLIELTQFDKGNLLRKEVRKYDDNNKVIEVYVSRQEEGFQEHEIYVYNDRNMLIEKRERSQNFEFYTTRKYEYDINGNLIKEEGNWNNAKFQYKYDAWGNWTEKKEIKDSKIVNKTTRLIEYYN